MATIQELLRPEVVVDLQLLQVELSGEEDKRKKIGVLPALWNLLKEIRHEPKIPRGVGRGRGLRGGEFSLREAAQKKANNNQG